jgi:hypothetical protein
MISLIVAGGAFIGAATTQTDFTWPSLYNHTLLGERVLAEQVVTRNRWGTPMLPDGKGGYSLIAPVNPNFIAQSLIIPPKTGGPVYRPLPPELTVQVDVPDA